MKGSKYTRFRETVPGESEVTDQIAFERWCALDIKKDRLMGSMMRKIRMYQLQPGNDIPEDIVRRKTELDSVRQQMRDLEEDFPLLVSGSNR